MGQWRAWRFRKRFKRCGKNCQFLAVRIEIKGHVELGDDCVLRNNLVLRTHYDGRVVIGDRVELADYAMIAANERIEIGDDSYLGPHCVLRDNNHLFQGTDVHWRLTPLIMQPIRVGAGCYIGASTYVMPGVSIGDGAVIAPGSILTKDVGPMEMWAGSPARLVSHRLEAGERSSLRRHVELMSLFGAEKP